MDPYRLPPQELPFPYVSTSPGTATDTSTGVRFPLQQILDSYGMQRGDKPHALQAWAIEPPEQYVMALRLAQQTPGRVVQHTYSHQQQHPAAPAPAFTPAPAVAGVNQQQWPSYTPGPAPVAAVPRLQQYAPYTPHVLAHAAATPQYQQYAPYVPSPLRPTLTLDEMRQRTLATLATTNVQVIDMTCTDDNDDDLFSAFLVPEPLLPVAEPLPRVSRATRDLVPRPGETDQERYLRFAHCTQGPRTPTRESQIDAALRWCRSGPDPSVM